MNNACRAAFITICAFILASVLFTVYPSAEQARSISAKAGVLYEPESGRVIYGKSENLKLPMASTTKIMTALVAIENCDTDEIVTIDDRSVGIEGSSAYLKVGESLTMEELLYALLLQSANDAAVAIANHVGGSTKRFAEMMNERAESLGLTDTHFENPHGLDDKEHYTTAKELAVIASEALKNESLKAIFSTYKKTFDSDDRKRTYVNHNKLLRTYDGAVGVKTGFTKKCGRCLVGAAERDGLLLISVTLDAPDDWRDHAKMLDYGFRSLERLTLANPCDELHRVAVVDGDEEWLTVKNDRGISLVTSRGTHDVKKTVRLPHFISAPIKEGDEVGNVIYEVDGKIVGKVSLIAESTINNKDKRGFFERLFSKIFG